MLPRSTGARSASLVLASLLLGCELGQNLQDIGNAFGGENTTVKGEGNALIHGTFHSLRFDGNQADGVFVVALEVQEDEPERLLKLIPFPDGENHCSAGPASRYAAAVSRPGKEGRAAEARVPFVVPETETTPRALRFTTFACQVDDVEVPGSSLPLDSSFADEPGFIAQTEQGELYFVDPWHEELTLIASDLAPIGRNSSLAMFARGDAEDWMWTIESGRLVARDSKFRVKGRSGRGVTQVQHTTSGKVGVLVYQQDNGEVYLTRASNLSERKLLEEAACELSLGSGMKGLRVAYYSPCEARTLVLNEIEAANRRVLAEGVSNYRFVDERSDGPVMLYVTGEQPNLGVGPLWAKFGEQPPKKLGEQGHLALTRLTIDGQLKAILDWGERGGTFVRGDVGSTLETLAEHVVYYTQFGVIADWDGQSGTLYQFQGMNLAPVQKRVTNRGIDHDPLTERGLVLVDYDGDQGELTLIQDGEGTPLSQNVRADAYQFTVQLPTVTILSDYDAETGTATLRLRETDSPIETVVSEGVSEVLEVSWPRAGFLYGVPSGDRAGIWFTEAE